MQEGCLLGLLFMHPARLRQNDFRLSDPCETLVRSTPSEVDSSSNPCLTGPCESRVGTLANVLPLRRAEWLKIGFPIQAVGDATSCDGQTFDDDNMQVH
ncbi:hypothetical protein PoB_007064500 [Plakobranchus ocellatus]|uniref:Uncharacterized protein n=1 Tax=Plakobranchus ocellatus TaxID=259542 RepID=A0AAV4DJ24_9GAST|nr:hypothetical protein PoB_007064500 [Plakobranchus ocellatus]